MKATARFTQPLIGLVRARRPEWREALVPARGSAAMPAAPSPAAGIAAGARAGAAAPPGSSAGVGRRPAAGGPGDARSPRSQGFERLAERPRRPRDDREAERRREEALLALWRSRGF